MRQRCRVRASVTGHRRAELGLYESFGEVK